MLKIKEIWITSKYRKEIYQARRTAPTRKYCRRKYNWSNETFDSVHWVSVKAVRKKLTPTKFI